MNKKTLLILLALKCFSVNLSAQTNIFPQNGSAGIGTTAPNASALLEIISTSKGILIPRMTKNQRDAIASPATGLLIYQTNGSPSFYFYDGSTWKQLATGTGGANKTLSNLSGPTAVNADLLPGIDNSINMGSAFLRWKNIYASADAQINELTIGKGGGNINTNTAIGNSALYKNTSGYENTASGVNALSNNTTGFKNTASGLNALYNNTTGWFNTAYGSYALFSNTSGVGNTASGSGALNYNTIGSSNTATGVSALYSNTTGSGNTASGSSALTYNTTGFSNTADGAFTLEHNTTGSNNTANGYSALYSNTTGTGNTASGKNTLYNNTTGFNNTASGSRALYNNISGSGNTANGNNVLFSNTTGLENTSNGNYALYSNTTGSYNIANGNYAIYSNTTGFYNTASGYSTLINNTTGSYNTAIGTLADVNAGTYTNTTIIGYEATGTASNQVRVGNNNVTSIGGYANWSNISDGRVKKDIKENVPGLVFINKLKPVTYHLDLNAADKILRKQEPNRDDNKSVSDKVAAEEKESRMHKEKILQTGFIAQDVEKVAKELGYDFSGVDAAKNDQDLYALRYAEFVVPLVKAVQELSKQNDESRMINDELKSEIVKMKSQMEALKKTIAFQQETNKQQVTINEKQETVKLDQNIPNPFRGTTTINCYLPSNNGNAYLNFYSQSGALLKSIKVTGEGKNTITLTAKELAAGTYKYALVIDGKVMDSKLMVKQ